MTSLQRTLVVAGIESDRHTGAGLIERELVARLPRHLGDDWVVDHRPGSTGMVRRLTAGAADAAVSLWLSSPLPLAPVGARHAHVVYDLRWRETRGAIARQYRRLDLRRVLDRSDHVFTISERSAIHLRDFAERPVDVSVMPLGPGQMEGRGAPAPVDSRRIVMIGRAAHKRNELLARLLVESSAAESGFAIDAINVSDETLRLLDRFRGDWTDHGSPTTTQMAGVLGGASVYAALGLDEGFGLPYVEAAYLGCDVVAVEGTVAAEVLGDEATFVSRDPTVQELERALDRWEERRVDALRTRARRRSWDDTARHVAAWLSELPGDRDDRDDRD